MSIEINNDFVEDEDENEYERTEEIRGKNSEKTRKTCKNQLYNLLIAFDNYNSTITSEANGSNFSNSICFECTLFGGRWKPQKKSRKWLNDASSFVIGNRKRRRQLPSSIPRSTRTWHRSNSSWMCLLELRCGPSLGLKKPWRCPRPHVKNVEGLSVPCRWVAVYVVVFPVFIYLFFFCYYSACLFIFGSFVTSSQDMFEDQHFLGRGVMWYTEIYLIVDSNYACT